MKELFRCIRAEFMKMRHTFLYPLHIAAPVMASAVFLLYYRAAAWSGAAQISGYVEVIGVALPFMVSVVCAGNVGMEEKNHFQAFLGGTVCKWNSFLAKSLALSGIGTMAVLEREGYAVTLQDNPLEIDYERLIRYQLILLDVMMPGIDGFSLCRKIRDKVDCPILFVTAKTAENELMEGLGVGGDDYIRKPFGIGELRARVAAHLRREQREKKHMVVLGEVQFSLREKKVYCQEAEAMLTKSEYAICEYLALNRGQVFTKERILEHVFGFDGESNHSAITEHIKNIRAKFQKFGINPVETVWGIGYRWK